MPIKCEHFAPPSELIRSVDDAFASLLSGARKDRIVQLAAALDFPVQTVCLECRLGADDARVDFAVCVFPGASVTLPGSFRALAAQSARSAWRAAGELLARWAEGDARFAQVPFVCVAFDLEGSAGLPAPCLSFCVDPYFFTRRLGLPAKASAAPSAIEALARAAYQASHDADLPDLCREKLARCLTCVPGVEARHLSLMLSRSPAALKLDLTLPFAELSRFLRELAWPGPPEQLRAALIELAPRQDRVQLNLVLHPSPETAALEVELCTEPAPAWDKKQRERLLRELVERGLVDTAKAAALRSFQDTPWVETQQGGRFARNWYLKIVFDGAVPKSVKTYVGLMPRVLRGPTAQREQAADVD